VSEKSGTETRTVAEELLDQLQAAWMSRRRGAFRDVCAPDVHWEDPYCVEPLHGTEELADHAARMWEAFPDAKIETAGVRLSSGRFAAAPVKITGTHLGEIDGITPSGRYVVAHAVLYCELDPAGERLWRVRVFMDGYEAAVQVGLLPKRGSIGQRALMVARGFGLRRWI
jgi:predicted ester cyclase